MQSHLLFLADLMLCEIGGLRYVLLQLAQDEKLDIIKISSVYPCLCTYD